MKVKEIMTKDVITVSPDMTVKEVAKILTEHNISGLPVVEDNKLVGIISEGDLIVQDKKLHFPNYIYLLDSILYLESFKKFEQDFKKMIAVKVKELMTTDVITANVDASIQDIATILTEEDINRIPVVDNEELVGIVSRGDIVHYMSEEL